MTTETEPMVRVVAVICEECGFEHTPENSAGGWDKDFSPSFVRQYYSNPKVCFECGAWAKGRVATEPVR